MATPHRLTDDSRAVLWRLWHEGRSHHAIARAVNITPVSVFLHLQKRGGIEPPARVRSPRHLTVEEREQISRGLEAGYSLRAIGRQLGRSPSTLSREVARNGGVDAYRALAAERAAWARARRPKVCLLARTERLRELVSDKLTLQWSPQQISGWLRDTYPDEPDLHVSHETIYKSLFIQSRGVLKKELRDHLRTRRRFRQSRHKTRKQPGGPILEAVSISERPAEIEDRAVPGHWEGDLIEGGAHTCIATLVERKTRYVILVKIRSKRTDEVVPALVEQMKRLPEELLRSLTWDRGSELAGHKQFSLAADMDVYFCDPRSPWQRGSNENTNGLLRQYLPKGTNLFDYTQAELDNIALRLNTRPRQTLAFKTPAFMLNQELGPGVAFIG